MTDSEHRDAVHLLVLQQLLERSQEIARRTLPAHDNVKKAPHTCKATIGSVANHFSREESLIKKASKAIDTVVQYIIKSRLGGVVKVVKAGSQARGTMISAHGDVDLVVYLACLDLDSKDWIQLYPTILVAYQQLMLIHGCFFNVKATSCAVQFSVLTEEDDGPFRHVVDVDLLFAPAQLFAVETPEEMQELLMTAPVEQRRYLSTGSAYLQAQEAKKWFAPAGLTELIRLMKRWILLQESSLRTVPCSYCLELVMRWCWQQVGDGISGTEEEKKEVLVRFFQACAKPDQLFVDLANIRIDEFERGPIVLDLVSPYLNTATPQHSTQNLWKKLKSLCANLSEQDDPVACFLSDLIEKD